jgi:queuine tRNA-ribosyltransferase
MKFSLLHQDGRARRGRMELTHGVVETPVFMPVGTQGTVKGMLPEMLVELGAQIVLGNTYHLFLRPGHELVRSLGGLHRFMNWERPILTDSGGYQVFSLSRLRSIREDGVDFQSHLDGSRHLLTPELSIAVQETLGSDIAMAFDECIPYPAERSYVEMATERSSRWAARSKAALSRRDRTALFGIVQGGMFEELRARSAAQLQEIGFDGYALGGLALGEGSAQMYDMFAYALPLLPDDAPRYIMGVGTPEDLVEGVARGGDMFDCVMPTRNARNGLLFTTFGKLSIKQSRFRDDSRPIDEACGCYVCRHYSRAYLRHLYLCGEILSSVLNTYHNLFYYVHLMRQIGQAIEQDRFEAFRAEFYRLRTAGE